MREGVLIWRPIPSFQKPPTCTFTRASAEEPDSFVIKRRDRIFPFASLSVEKRDETKDFPPPSLQQLFKHPLSLLAFVPREVALFTAGAIAGAAAKTVTAPLDRVKLLMQTHKLRVVGGSTKKGIGFIEAITLIGKEEGIKGYWKGNLPQVIHIIPYGAVQLFAYESYKKLFRGKDGELSVVGRLVAGACAGMTSTIGLAIQKQQSFQLVMVVSMSALFGILFTAAVLIARSHFPKLFTDKPEVIRETIKPVYHLVTTIFLNSFQPVLHGKKFYEEVTLL